MADVAFDAAIDRLIRGMVTCERISNASVITMPSMFPSGAAVQVQASFDGTSIFVTDLGLAHQEAEYLGATNRLFNGIARSVASDFGISYDNHSFFVLQVPLDRIEGAIRVVGAASHKAAVQVEMNVSEQAQRNDQELLLDRLKNIFGRANVDEDFEVAGSSAHRWTVASRVVSGGREALFDIATKSHTSVFSIHTKFNDISRLENAPTGVVAVPKRSDFKIDYLNILQQSASVIEIGAPDEVYRKFPIAA